MKYSERATEPATQQSAKSHDGMVGSAGQQGMTSSKTELGFWIYLMTDCVLFASLFATFAVLRDSTFGGPTREELFSLPFVLTETMILLFSSFAAGMGLLAAKSGQKVWTLRWFGLAFILGALFVGLELYEFNELASEGHSWRASAFLSAFFTLVATHGLHVTVGLVWMGALMLKVYRSSLTKTNVKRLGLLAMFWHFLDIVWIFIFTIVYLFGAASI